MSLLRRLKRKVERVAAFEPPARRTADDLPLLEWTARYLPALQERAASPFHEWLCRTLDGLPPGAKASCVSPRGNGKSSYASFAYPLREAAEGRRNLIVLLSDTAAQSRRFLAQIRREIESNETLRADYPACRPGRVWRDNWLALRNGTEITALSAGGRIRGLKSLTNKRPDLVVADDVQSKEHSQSALKRERTLEWLTKDVLAAGEPNTRFFVVGTPMHRDDVVSTLERTPGWGSRRWKSVIEWPTRLDLWQQFEELLHTYDLPDDDDDGTKRKARALAFYEANRAEMDRGAVTLWPSMWPLGRLMLERATLGRAAFEAEYNCNPVDPSTCEWPEHIWDRENLLFDEWPAQLAVKTLALDPSKGKDARRGDPSAIVRFGRDRFGVEYVECDLKRRPIDVQCADLARHCAEFRPDGVAVEVNQMQELMLVPIRAAFREAGVEATTVYGIDNTVNKEVRIRRLTTPFAQKRMRFKSRSPGTHLLLQHARDWPASSADDSLDALEVGRRLAVMLTDGTIKPKKRR